MIPYILVISFLFLIVVLLFYSKRTPYENIIDREEPVVLTGKPCPICQWPLQKNERVHSVIYRTEGDSIMHIYGCPYCYQDHPKSKFQHESIRSCPACKKPIKKGEFIIARLFEKPGKNHVHVLGCYRCRGKR